MPNQDLVSLLADDSFQQEFLDHHLPAYLLRQRWFTSKGRPIQKLQLQLLPSDKPEAALALIEIEFQEGDSETRVLALGLSDELLPDEDLHCICQTPHGWLVDALSMESFRQSLFQWMQKGVNLENELGQLQARSGPYMQENMPDYDGSVLPDQHSSNTVLSYGKTGFFKLFRKTEPGLHPDAELIAYLSDACGFESVPPFGGDISFLPKGSLEALTLGLMLGRVEARGEAWFTTLEDVAAFAKTYRESKELPYIQIDSDLGKSLHPDQVPAQVREAMGEDMLRRLDLLGKRTAEMHLHFSVSDEPGMEAEALDETYWEGARNALRMRLQEESHDARRDISLALKDISRWLDERQLPVLPLGRIRVHGDYHLGQVLDTGDDMVIIDFEGEPLHDLAYRRRTHSPYKDVAGMARSLHYAPYAHALQKEEGAEWAMQAASLWYTVAARLFLTSYFDRVGKAEFVPISTTDHEAVLAFFLADKAVYELAYERASRPDWLHIPREGLLGIARMLQGIR